ncbi:PAX-interacting protein 1-like [Artemia franciscana]|uniref:PAX-interacting protein 1-like n=1 Tax=Artemia franciscana TaxID=6661 RepID=UPI0032DA0068
MHRIRGSSNKMLLLCQPKFLQLEPPSQFSQQVQRMSIPQQILRQVVNNQENQVIRVSLPQQQQQPSVVQQKVVQQVQLPLNTHQNVTQQHVQIQQQQVQNQQQLVQNQPQQLQNQQQQVQNQQQQAQNQQKQAQNQQQQAQNQQQQVLAQQSAMQQQIAVDPNGNPLVNPKTKTALATLLTSRLQTTQVVSPSPPLPQLSPTIQSSLPDQRAPSVQATFLTKPSNQPMTPQQQEQYMNQQLQKRQQAAAQLMSQQSVLSKTPVAVASVQPPGTQQSKGTAFTVSRISTQFYGHEPTVKLPGDLCLLGCVFIITDYHKSKPQETVSEWKKVINRYGGEIESTYGPRITHVLCCHLTNPFVQQAIRDNKRCVTAFWLNDVVIKQQLFPPTTALHLPLPFSDDNRPCHKMTMSVSAFEGDDRIKVKAMIEQLGAKYTGYFSKNTSILVCKKGDGEKYKRAREWRVAVVTVQWLTEMLVGSQTALKQAHHPKYHDFNAAVTDIFKIDYGHVQPLMGAWKTPIRVTQEIYEKFKSSPLKRLMPLKRKLSDPKPGEPTLKKKKPENEITTGSSLDAILDDVVKGVDCEPKKGPFIRFSNTPNSAELGKIVSRLDGNLASTAKEATHLVMKSVTRTVNFLACVSTVKYIVTPDWIIESEKENHFVDETPFLIQSDKTAEETFGFSLSSLLGTPGRNSFLKDKTFYLVHGLNPPGRQAMADIIESAGGTVDTKRRSSNYIKEVLTEKPESYLVLCCREHLTLVRDLLEANIGVYTPEVVMSGILRQKMDLKSNCFMVGDIVDD